MKPRDWVPVWMKVTGLEVGPFAAARGRPAGNEIINVQNRSRLFRDTQPISGGCSTGCPGSLFRRLTEHFLGCVVTFHFLLHTPPSRSTCPLAAPIRDPRPEHERAPGDQRSEALAWFCRCSSISRRRMAFIRLW